MFVLIRIIESFYLQILVVLVASMIIIGFAYLLLKGEEIGVTG